MNTGYGIWNKNVGEWCVDTNGAISFSITPKLFFSKEEADSELWLITRNPAFSGNPKDFEILPIEWRVKGESNEEEGN